jgi:hypothetical protein
MLISVILGIHRPTQDPPAHHPSDSLKRSLNDCLVRKEALKRKHPKHRWYMQKHSHASGKHPFHAPGKHKTRQLAESPAI